MAMAEATRARMKLVRASTAADDAGEWAVEDEAVEDISRAVSRLDVGVEVGLYKSPADAALAERRCPEDRLVRPSGGCGLS
jgi:hypothetical protein